MLIIFYLWIFFFGLAIGSFLNVLIDRLPKEETISGRSHCDHCEKQLEWYDLAPVFSFLILLGRCRYCGKKISIQNPLVELATGILFVVIFNFQFSLLRQNFGGQAIFNQFPIFNFQKFIAVFYFLFIVSALIVIFVSDLKTYIIPDKIIYPAIGAAIAYQVFGILNFNIGNLLEIRNFKLEIFSPVFLSFAAAFLASGFFLALFLISRGNWIGFGDVKLGILMGLVLGWPDILIALFLAYFFGAIMGVGLILSGKKGLKSEMPFGPFLVLGMFIAMFWGGEIIKGYLSLFFL